MLHRRQLLQSGLAWPLGLATATVPARSAGAAADPALLLKQGGVVMVFRHALAPGTFDPPGFRLGECSTQRNLSDEGRAQSRRIGQWFSQRGLQPTQVRSSPWCRCVDTATLAFGRAEPWPALGSPVIGTETTNQQALSALRGALQSAAGRPGQFEVWVTHMFIMSALLPQENPRSGEGWVLGAGPQGRVELLAKLVVG